MHKPRFESLVNGPMRRDLEKRLPNEKRLQTSLTSFSGSDLPCVRPHYMGFVYNDETTIYVTPSIKK